MEPKYRTWQRKFSQNVESNAEKTYSEMLTKADRLKALCSSVFVKFYFGSIRLHIDITKKQARRIIESDNDCKFQFMYSNGFLFISEK